MRTLPLNARLALDAGVSSGEIEIVLLRITSPSGASVIHVSTDPTEMIRNDPLAYGTRSKWLAPSSPATIYYFVHAMAQLPDDTDSGPGVPRIVLPLVDQSTISVLRSTVERATIDMAVVLASNPDIPIFQQRGMKLVGGELQGTTATLTLAADPIGEEYAPTGRQTRTRFPGLFA